MFHYLTRSKPSSGTNNYCVLWINDTCFKERIIDYCPCHNKSCGTSLEHLITLYERRHLNVAKNLARYYLWLQLNNIIYDHYMELRKHHDCLKKVKPTLAVRFNKYYKKSVEQYFTLPHLIR